MSPLLSDEQNQTQIDNLHRVWAAPKGWRSWSEVNNDVVGNWYLITTFVFFLFGGALAMLIRAQLAIPGNTLLSVDLYNQVFTLHGSVMMFLFAVPIFEAFSIRVLPSMLGARDLPFPRLSAFGYWCFLIGGVFFCGSIFFKVAPAGGWFMYPPLTTRFQEGPGADVWLLGLSFIEVASIAAAVELIVGILKCRAPGMRLNLMPLYALYLLVTAVMILFAFPPLIVGDLLFELEREFDWPFFDAARGGDPLLWQHLFWIFGHPEVYIVFLPAVGLVAMIVATFARQPVEGYSWVVLSAVGTGFLSFGLWVHHMFTTGLPGISLGFFSAASEMVAFPTGIQIFCLIATVLTGQLVRSVPMLYILGALAIFVIGGLTGVMVAIAPFDFQAHDSYFIVAHLHYVMIGGVVLPLVAALTYFYPLLSGKQLSERLGRWAFWMIFAGFNITFLPMHITGLAGMPRRVYTYQSGLGIDTLNLVSSLGAVLLFAGFAVFVADLLWPRKKASGTNPWNAGTLEWLPEQLPDHPWGLRSIPHVTTRYPLWEQPGLIEDVRAGKGYLADAAEGRRETLVSTAADAIPQYCLRVGGPSFAPMIAAIFTGGAFIAPVFKAWWLAGFSSIAAGATILWWLWTGTGDKPEKPMKDVGRGLQLPLYASGSTSTGWWAMLVTMVGDSTAFASLVFGYFFFWTVQPDFPPANAGPGAFWPAAAAAVALFGWLALQAAKRWNAAAQAGQARAAMATAALCALAAAAMLVAAPWQAGLDPTAHVYPAIVWVLCGWAAVHLALGSVMALYVLARAVAGRLTAEHDAELHNVALYWHFLLVTVAVTAAVVGVFPVLA